MIHNHYHLSHRIISGVSNVDVKIIFFAFTVVRLFGDQMR